MKIPRCPWNTSHYVYLIMQTLINSTSTELNWRGIFSKHLQINKRMVYFSTGLGFDTNFSMGLGFTLIGGDIIFSIDLGGGVGGGVERSNTFWLLIMSVWAKLNTSIIFVFDVKSSSFSIIMTLSVRSGLAEGNLFFLCWIIVLNKKLKFQKYILRISVSI